MHGLKKNWLAVVLVVICLAPLACAQHVGKVTALIPEATGDNKPLKQNDAVSQGEAVKTNKTGRLKITLNDGSRLTLGGDSSMKVSTHDANSHVTSIDLIGGRLRNQVNALTGAGQKYEVRTAVAVAGVIGTDFEVVTNPDGSITVYCFSGQVLVTSANGLGNVTLGPGQSVTVSPTQMGTVQNFDPSSFPGEDFTPPYSGPSGGGGLTGGQIAGITIGVIGGAVTGVMTTSGGSPNGNPFATPTPCILPSFANGGIHSALPSNCFFGNGVAQQPNTVKPTTSAHASTSAGRFGANAIPLHHWTYTLPAQHFTLPSSFGAVSKSSIAPTYTGRTWFTSNSPVGLSSHMAANFMPRTFFLNKPGVNNAASFALRHWQVTGAHTHTTGHTLQHLKQGH